MPAKLKTEKIEENIIAPKVVKAEKKVAVKSAGLSVPLYDLTGKETGKVELPKDLFGVEVNTALLSQALRIYLNNQKSHPGSTKTRGEVRGSTRKIYKQKGTGGARHGGKRAPIFVGGGIALGPKYRKNVLDLSKKMKKAALISALSSKALSGEIIAVSGLDKTSGKTSQMSAFFNAINAKSLLLITSEKNDMVKRATKNLQGMLSSPVDQLNVLQVIKHKMLVVDQALVERLNK